MTDDMLRSPLQVENELLDDASRALFQLGRVFARLQRGEWPTAAAGPDAELGMIVLVQTVDSLQEAGAGATVGAVAGQLHLSPSTASRLVARGVQAGYLRRIAVQHDGRAVALELTDTGRALEATAARYQRSVFDTVTAGWTNDERQTFARLFVKFAASVAAMPAVTSDQPERRPGGTT